MDALSLAVLLPLIHPNLLAPFLSSIGIVFSVVLYKYANVMKSALLYAPDETTSFAMHPIFKLKRQGVGVYNLMLKVTLIVLSLTPVFMLITLALVPIYKVVRKYIPYLVVTLCALNWKDIKSAVFFLVCGILGLFLLDNNTIIPIFTGLFGIPLLLAKEQKNIVLKEAEVSKRGVLKGILNSFLILFTPAVGPAQASLLARKLSRDDLEKVSAIAAVNAMEVPISLGLLVGLGSSRIGALNYVKVGFIGALKLSLLIVFLSLVLYPMFLTVRKLNNAKLLKLVSLALIVIICYVLGVKSLICLLIFSSLGIVANKLRINLSNGMGVLVFPYLTT